jgi:site-specific recombinase XerD
MASINDYVAEFERQLKLSNNAQSTIETYCGILRVFLKTVYKRPESITQRMVEDYLLKLQSTKTKRQTIYTLQKFYRLVMNMPGHLDKLIIPKQEKFVPTVLNIQEIFKIFGAIDNLKQRACLQLIYACGLRIGEVVNIKIADIDGVKKQLHIRQAKGAKDRIVPIPDETIMLLREYYKVYKPTNYLFAGQIHSQYSERSIQQTFKAACKRAGIRKYVTVHSLRHSRATHLVDNGVDMSLIQKFLGHSNIKTTVDFYLHTSIATMQDIFARVDSKLLNNSLPVINNMPHKIAIFRT